MFRFTIRDVLWLTVVVAVAAGRYAERATRWRLIHQLLEERQQLFQAAGERGFVFVKTDDGFATRGGGVPSHQNNSN